MSLTSRFDEPMRLALAEAARANEISQDVPVGAVLINAAGQVVAVGRNERELTGDPTAHAEVVAIRAASQGAGNWRLEELTLVVTLEPCVMCAGAILAARIGRVVFGAFDDRVGAGGSLYDLLRDRRLGAPVEVIGEVLADDSSALLRQFFESRRTSGSK